MSDNKTPEPEFGEPVEEPTHAENVVDRANEALADAEAARDEVAGDAGDASADANVTAKAGSHDEPDWSLLDDAMVEQAAADAEAAKISADAAAADAKDASASARDAAADARDAETAIALPAVAKPEESKAPTWRDDPEVDAATAKLPESVKDVTDLTPPPAARVEEDEVLTGRAPAQPIFVQAPEAPDVRGNRGAAGAIGLLAALVFAVLYLVGRLLFSGIDVLNPQELLDETMRQVTSFAFWVPVAIFFLAFWLLGAFINRGKWGYWVVWGLLVGIAAYLGHAVGAVVQAGPWNISMTQASELFTKELLSPAAIVALVVGRELPIWFGAWIAKRGRRMTELNAEAQAEYEKTLEAGPQLASL